MAARDHQPGSPRGSRIVRPIDLYRIVIEIKDSGSGISKEKLSKIFQPYFSTKEKGTGLGLSIAYRIISDHKGKIEVKSEVGKGTIFTIKLPIT